MRSILRMWLGTRAGKRWGCRERVKKKGANP